MDWPQTKSVRREDLHSDASSIRSQSPDSNLEAQYLEKLGTRYDDLQHLTADGDGIVTVQAAIPDSGNDDLRGYDFRLFSNSTKSGAATDPGDAVHKVALRSPTPESRDPGFVVPKRPYSFYFTGPLSSDQAQKFQQAVISGPDLIKGLSTKWRGCELPWRVKVVQSSPQKKPSTSAQSNTEMDSKTRKRSGKKRRIIIRKRLAEQIDRRSLAQQTQADREEAEKEKRNKKNRDRKIKRRQKEREKKVAQSLETG